jgi:hypothetical protein
MDLLIEIECLIKTVTENKPNKIVTFRPDDPPWMHNDLRNIIRQRKRLRMTAKRTKSPDDWIKYRKIRNICVNKVRNARQNYYLKLGNELKTSNFSPKHWWSTF